MGRMEVDFKMLSRDLKKSVRIENAVVDPRLSHTIAPLHWLEALRSPSLRLPNGYYETLPICIKPPPGIEHPGPLPSLTPLTHSSIVVENASLNTHDTRNDPHKLKPNGIRAGPLIAYITGEMHPVVLNVDFVDECTWPGMKNSTDCDIRLGMDAISQCSLHSELLPGGLLSEKSISELKKQGMVCGLSESPLSPRPYTRMKHMFIDELQRGPALKEFIGYNPRLGTEWRFTQHCKHFRQGIFRDITRRKEMNQGLHHNSSWQKSMQQSVPEIRFMAPGP